MDRKGRQMLAGLGLVGGGIVSVLIVAGIILSVLKIGEGAGNVALWAGVAIGVILGILGIVGVIITLLKRL